jgi:hypothetical protein
VKQPELKPCTAPFPAKCVSIGFGERLAVQIEPLTFVTQFVRFDGRPRASWDWLLPRFLQ